MADYTLNQINNNECIGNSLSTINLNFTSTTNSLVDLQNRFTSLSADNSTKVAGLIAGNNVTIVPGPTPNSYIINSSFNPIGGTGGGIGVLSILDGINVGGQGARVFKQAAADRKLEFRRLISGGSNVVISEEGDLIKITALDRLGGTGGEVNTTSNHGTGVGLAKPKQGFNLPFKSLVAGPGISINSNTDTVTINNTRNTTAQNVGTGAGLLQSAFNNNLTFKSLVSGSPNIKIIPSGNEIQLAVVETLSAANTGNGAGIFREKDVFTNRLIFKGLVGSNPPAQTNYSPCDVSFSETINSVNLTVTDRVTAANIPTTTFIPPVNGQAGRIFKDKNGNTLNFKTIVPGNNIQITNSINGNEVIISTTSNQLSGGENNIGANVGTGKQLYKEKNGIELVFRTLEAGPGIDLIEGTDTVLISATSLGGGTSLGALTGINLGGGIGFFSSVSATQLRFKTLNTTTPFIRAIDNPSTNTVTLSVGNVVRDAQNDPSGSLVAAGVYRYQEDNSIILRKIAAGTGITVAEQGGDIVISNTFSIPTLPSNIGSGFKNKIINGNFDVWERQNKVGITPSGALSAYQINSLVSENSFNFSYLADRVGFYAGTRSTGLAGPIATFSKIPVSFADTANTGALSAISPSYVGRVTLGTRALSAYVPTTIGQRIENIQTLAGKTVTFSFWARSNNEGSNSANISYIQCYRASAAPLNSACINYPGTYVSDLVLFNTWQRYSFTFTIAPISESFLNSVWTGLNNKDYVWDSFTQIGIEIPGNQNRWVEVAGLQLEENTVATDFEKRPIATELTLCQRYYETGNRLQTQFATNSANTTFTSFKVTKRKAPTMLSDYGVLLANSITNIPNVFITNHTYDTTTVDGFTTSFSGENVIGNTKPFIYNWAASAEF